MSQPLRLGALLSALALLLLTGLAGIPAATAAVVLSHGHIDAFHVTAENNSLTLDLKEDATGRGVRHAPEDVTLRVGEKAWSEASKSVPEIGKAGYLLPQTQNAELIWPGWNTEHAGTAVDLEFAEVSGPGEVYVFQTNLNSVASVLGGGYVLTSGSVIRQEAPAHVHANWLFTEAGTYTMRVKAKGGGASSKEATYTWQVGEDSAAAKTEKKPHQAPVKTHQAPATPAAPVARPAAGGEAKQCSPALYPRVKDDRTVPGKWVNPGGLTFGLGTAAKTQLPQAVGPVPAGTVWMIGSTQQAGVPWLGANTQAPSLIEHTTGEVTWELVSVDGPGPMVVFTQGGLGQVVGEEWFRASGGKVQGSHTIQANSHVHPSWVFGKEGTYRVTVRHTATMKDGQAVSGTGTLVFVVGGQGNANDGHFDVGSILELCGASGEHGGAGGAVGEGGEALADTGTTVMTVPFAVLGLGILVFGAGAVQLSRKFA